MLQILVVSPSKSALNGFCEDLSDKRNRDGHVVEIRGAFYRPKQWYHVEKLLSYLADGDNEVEIYIMLPASGRGCLWSHPEDGHGLSKAALRSHEREKEKLRALVALGATLRKKLHYVVYPTTEEERLSVCQPPGLSALRARLALILGGVEPQVWCDYDPAKQSPGNAEIIDVTVLDQQLHLLRPTRSSWTHRQGRHHIHSVAVSKAACHKRCWWHAWAATLFRFLIFEVLHCMVLHVLALLQKTEFDDVSPQHQSLARKVLEVEDHLEMLNEQLQWCNCSRSPPGSTDFSDSPWGVDTMSIGVGSLATVGLLALNRLR
mmetsp:Transcript_10690/g.24357  ORF Transcript_10690/g.24357 Transcript_10690/m.24357 type:complete len:319 (-) Transcript_10690:45-1001(-)